MKKNLLRVIALSLCLLLMLAAGGCASKTEAKNIILLIGDGMGFNHLEVAKVSADLKELNLETLPKKGEITTYSADNEITDSAAAATAYATGQKTNNGMVSVDPNENELPTIAELAKQKGMKVGLVATKNITDATPAAFSSHVAARGSAGDIAYMQIDSGFNLFLGGGQKDYMDKLDYVAQQGYTYIENPDELEAYTGDKLFGLFAYDHMMDATQKPLLVDMTKKAISLLDNEKGFFLMVEGSYIDMASHNNDAEGMVSHLLAFDEAVKYALEYAKQDKNTLVLICADHETGGITLPDPFTKENIDASLFTSTHHTAANVPLFAYGPSSAKAKGTIDNTDLFKIMANAIKVTP